MRFVVRRPGPLLFILWGAVTLLFFLFFLLPERPGRAHRRRQGQGAPTRRWWRTSEEKYGLDEPVSSSTCKYLGRLVTFDFGESYSNGEPVTEIIKDRAPASLRLAIWAILIEAFVGIGAGDPVRHPQVLDRGHADHAARRRAERHPGVRPRRT